MIQKKLRRWGPIAAVVLVSALTLPLTSAGAAHQTPGAAPGAAKAAAGSSTAGVPTSAYGVTLRGGYVAAGVGLRNRGHGTINITGIPPGATINRAFLLWSILGGATPAATFNKGRINGTAITGTNVGSGVAPCWPGTTVGYGYRSDVTARVTGNGAYNLSGFASGQVNGADPFTSGSTPPLAEGASLVVIYSKATYPNTRVLVSSGYAETQAATLSTTMSWGFAASNPVGQVRTTYIGGDGQSNFSEPVSTFNGVAVPSADWDGTDPPLPRYSSGNLWDTDSSNVGTTVHPGNTSATVSVTGGPDCLVWVGQVLSIGTNGAADTDGDKLLDGWEANGYDANGDGTVDVALPLANVVRKDLFVEMDYMGAETTCPCHLPLAGDLDRIVHQYSTAPGANNPNGTPGYNLHLDAGSARGAAYNLGGGNLVPFDADLNPVASQFNAIKAANFNPNRAKIYYYMIWAHGYDGGSSSGNAFAIPNDSFVVTLGLWPGGGTSDVKVGTFIHEFGHDLGLLHGGNDNVNYKPNYLSVMNYRFQVSGIPRINGQYAYFGYSYSLLPNLVETSLNEAVGLNSAGANTFRTQWTCPNTSTATSPGTANGPLDWNCNGVASGVVAADVNGDGLFNTLTTRDDWHTLVFGGGAVGGGVSAGADSSVPAPTKELTAEEAAGLSLIR